VSTIGVHVHATVKHCGGILAETALDKSLASRVLVDEVGDIVDNTCDGNKTTTVLGLLDVIFPLDDGELVKGNTPV